MPNGTNDLFAHLLVKCILSIRCVPGTVVDVVDMWMN